MRFTKKFITQFAYSSNLIENIHFPLKIYESVYDHLKKAKVINRKWVVEYRPIFNTYAAIDYLKEHQSEKITKEHILKVHSLLTEGILEAEYSGSFRNCNIYVGGGICDKPREVLSKINAWIDMWGKRHTHPLTRHYEFECIHPFVDGNGRCGRILLVWDCLFHNEKPITIEIENRREYYDSIQRYRLHRPLGIKTNEVDEQKRA